MSDQETDEPQAKKAKLTEKSPVDELRVKKDIDFTEDVTEIDNSQLNQDLYNDYVMPEELNKLLEYKVLDEVNNEEDSNDEVSDSSDGKSEGLPEEEIEKMLEEGLPDGFKGAPKPIEKNYFTKQKIILEDKGVNHFEVLPVDWIVVRHYSGMPVYMHRPTRVCTLSKPYFLGEGNTRRHDVPISAIPCLAYRKALEEESKQAEIDRQIQEQIKNGTWANATHIHTKDKTKEGDKTTKTPQKKVESANKSDGGEGKVISRKGSQASGPFRAHPTDIQTNYKTNESDKATKTLENKVESANKAERSEVKVISREDSQASCPFWTNPTDIHTNTKSNESDKATKTLEKEVESANKAEGSEVKVISNEASQASGPFQHSTDPSNFIFETTFVLNIEEIKVEEDTYDETSQSETNLIQTSKDVNTNDDKSEERDEQRKLNGVVSQSSENSISRETETTAIPAYNRQPVVLPGGLVMPPPRVETINTSWKSQHLSHEQVNEYCKNLFKFKVISIMQFRRWADRRKYTKSRKTLQYPTLPEGTKLITIPAQPAGQENGTKSTKRDWVMNMNGRSYLSVFHEYVRRALQKQPVYEFKQLENAASPYQATVFIGGMQYGVGHGSSKRQAKSAAARASIHILIPEMGDELEPRAPDDGQEPDFSFFDYVGIEDPRITEFCASTCEPSPHAILRTCLLRNFGAGDTHIHTEIKKLECQNQKIELTMKVGKHTATVVCKNKKAAKQRASQTILQALHPHIRSWGSLLRLYGSRSVKSCKQRKLEEQQITLLQDQARHNQPNVAVLCKLRAEMGRLRARERPAAPAPRLRLPAPPRCHSDLNNVDL